MRPKTNDPLVDSDTGLPRTPVAWRHRELHLPQQTNLMSQTYYQPIPQPLPSVISTNHHNHHHHQQPHQQQQHYHSNSHSYHSSTPPTTQPSNHHNHHHPSSLNHRTSSPSVLTTSSDDREEIPMVRHHHHSSSRRHNGSIYSTTIDRRRSKHYSQSNLIPQLSTNRGSIVSYGPGPIRNYQRTATLRSTRSYPGLVMAQVGTFDGEPCPVHGSNHPVHHHQSPIIPGPPLPPPLPPLPLNPRHLSIASHHQLAHPYDHHHHHHPHPHHPTSASLLAHPVHNQQMLTVKRFNSLSDLRRPSLPPLIAYPGNSSAIGLGPPVPQPGALATQGASNIAQYECFSKSLANKLPMPTYVGTMFHNNNGSTSFVPSGAQIMIPGHGSAPIEAIKSHLASANQVDSLIYDDSVCCKGHLIVLWIILTVVTIGVISGIILGVTAN